MGNAYPEITELVEKNPVMLFMKGDRKNPQCGFSARVVQILNQMGVAYTTFDVLENPKIRQDIKEYSQWPTVPQLYVQGEFLGGCDIVTEMYQNGELEQFFHDKGLLKAPK